MRGLYNLVIKNLKINRKKTITILFTIMIATILITASSLIPLNIYKDYTKRTREESGKYQVLINNLDKENLKNIMADNNITQSGSSTLYGIKGEEKFSMFYYDEKAFELSPFKLLEGNLAKTKGEIILDENYIKANNLTTKLGESIGLKYVDIEGNEKEERFKLVGISSSTSQAKVKGIYYGFISREQLSTINEENLLWTVYLNTAFKTLGDVDIYTAALEETFKIKADDIRLNDLYISSGKVDWNLVLGGAMVILIVMLTTIMIIYSIFHIVINERINEFGKLRVLGATSKNIKIMIFKEGIIISMLGIPLGLFIGWAATNFISRKFLFENMSFDFMSEGVLVLLAGIITLITVLLSLIKPANMAGKISAIEAIKYTEANIKFKRFKSEKEINLFNLTKLNMIRNRKRSYLTIFSIMISFILLSVISTVVESFNMEKAANRYVSGDYVLSASRDFMDYKYDVFDESFINNLKKIGGVKEVNTIGLTLCSFKNEGNLALNDNSEVKTIDSYILGYEKSMIEDLEEGLIEGKINYEGLKKNEIIIFRNNDDKRFNTSIEDKIILQIKDKKGNLKNTELKVQAIIDSEYMESLDIIGVGEIFLTSKELMDKIYEGDSSVKIQINGEGDAIKNFLEEFLKGNNLFMYQSRELTKEELEKDFLGIKIVAYSLTILILVVSILNYINTMEASVIARRKEFATFQAIGITSAGIKKMLNIEGNLYISIGGGIGIILGSALGFVVVKFLENQAIFINYKYPIIIVLVVILFALIVKVLLIRSLQRKISKETIVERLKQ
ncbi:MAG: FtsX-like permease family protein [Sarcina sp.]